MKFYITTAIPYVNGKPHIGHALEFVQSDVLARYHRILGDETTLLSGADENALKNVQAAEAVGKAIQEFVDENAQLFADFANQYNVQLDVFQKGSDTVNHYASSQKLWTMCNEAGDIYEKEYEGLYCVGCEMFYTEDELNENGECHNHPGRSLQAVKEKNYFFRLSKYQNKLSDLIKSGTLEIFPEARKNEVLSFVEGGLEDISISRSNERAKNWGVPVPGDDTQRIYVWFDGLNIYQSGVGFGWDDAQYKKWWPADVHVIGKDIVRFHAVYWPAFLMSAGLQLPKRLLVHGFITSEGQKMSKTLGNVVDPIEFGEEFGFEPVRYYLMREIPSGKDGDISHSRFVEVYNADLANGLGNIISRTAALCGSIEFDGVDVSEIRFEKEFKELIEGFKFDSALEWVAQRVRMLDKYINENEPWKVKNDPVKLKDILQHAVDELILIGFHLQPFMPETAEKMLAQFSGKNVTRSEPYFARL